MSGPTWDLRSAWPLQGPVGHLLLVQVNSRRAYDRRPIYGLRGVIGYASSPDARDPYEVEHYLDVRCHACMSSWEVRLSEEDVHRAWGNFPREFDNMAWSMASHDPETRPRAFGPREASRTCKEIADERTVREVMERLRNVVSCARIDRRVVVEFDGDDAVVLYLPSFDGMSRFSAAMRRWAAPIRSSGRSPPSSAASTPRTSAIGCSTTASCPGPPSTRI